MESFFSLLQKNVLDRQSWATRQDLRLAIVAWIEGKYHQKCRQPCEAQLKVAATHDFTEAHEILDSELPHAQAKKVHGDVSQHWQRRESGNMRTLQQIIAHEGVVGQ